MNSLIDWKTYVVKFGTGNVLQAVAVALCSSRLSLQEVSAKTAVQLAKQQGSAAWFALLRGLKNVQTGLLASASGSSEPLVAAPPQFQSLVQYYHDVFAEPHKPAPGQVTHCIDLHDELLMPPRQRSYRMSHAEVAEAWRQVDSILEKGWIRPSSSLFGALLLFVCNKMGELRMHIDYHLLSKQTRLDRFPIPRIDDLLDKLVSATVFCKIDLSNAYHQVPIEEGHQSKTAFQTSFGLYEWVVFPLGLYNAPATFQRLMHNVFPALQHDFVVYLDDILFYSCNRTQHFEHVKYVLEQLRTHSLKAKAKKMELCLDQVKYLGHIMQNGTIRADPSKVNAVTEWPVTSDVKQLQRFLGLANYYNRFIHRFAHITALLTSLFSNNVPFILQIGLVASIDELKVPLTTTPVLQIPNFDHDFILEMDASAFAIRSALMQD